MKRPKKARNKTVNNDFLNSRKKYSNNLGYETPKWILFCDIMRNRGFEVSIYEAQRTVSKYVTVKSESKKFKVRFSNHKPIKNREINGDCDFFVGRTNLGISTTAQAVLATLRALN